MSAKKTKRQEQLKDLLKSVVGEMSGKDELNSLLQDVMKTAVETSLNAELDEHLGYKKHERHDVGNSRNGSYSKKLRSTSGEIEVAIPRDRNSEYKPRFLAKGESRLNGFEDKILSCYARGMSTRDITETFEEMFDATISPEIVSQVTASVIDKFNEWQNRALDEVYPIMYLDCIQVKVRQDKRIINKAIYLALGVNLEGHKELLGMWVSENEGSKFWLSVLTELNNRGVKDILIACVDGLTGFPDAIASVFPKTTTQLCIVHMIRNSLRYVSWKDRKKLASALKKVYTSPTADEARSELEKLKSEWDNKYPSVYRSWDSRWDNVVPFFEFPESIRKVIYTTNAIESLNSVIRKAIKNRKIFPNDNSAFKTIFLATEKAAKKWTMPIRDWGIAMQFFSVAFEERIKLN